VTVDGCFTPEQRALQDAVDRWVQREYGFLARERRRRDLPDGDPATWRQLAELGLLALPFPQALGGLGGGPVETMLAARSLGRALLLEPWLSTVVLAGSVLRAAGGEAASHWLPRIAEGTARASLACEEASSHGRLNHVGCRAAAESSGWRLDGRKLLVLQARGADAVIVSARTAGDVDAESGVSLFLLDPRSPGLQWRHYDTHDGLSASDLTLVGMLLPRHALIGPVDAGLPLLREAVDRTIGALAAEAWGLMELLLETTVEHLKTRQQFGKPLASFQVLQHAAVDMLIATEQVRSMACYASSAADWDDAAARGLAMSAVKVMVGRCARQAAQLAVQLHGAIGLTDECVVSHAFRRLMAIELQFGDVQHHLARHAAQAH